MVSILSITGVSLYITYNKTISSSKTTLKDFVEQQKSMILVFHEQGKSESEILKFINAMDDKYYIVGQTGEIAIANKQGDSAAFVFTHSNFPAK